MFKFIGGLPQDVLAIAAVARWTVLSTSYFQRDGGPRKPAIDLA